MTSSKKRPVVLIVRDGWGHNPYPDQDFCNAVVQADAPRDQRLLAEYPHVQIATSGEDVGLPDGVMGNSEVGHQNIGAGRIVDQELMRITRAIRNGSFFENQTLQAAVAHVQQSGGSLHLLGLVSDGGVHSHVDHACALIDFCQRAGLAANRLCVHAITDGRDTSPTGGAGYVKQLEDKLASAGIGRVASVVGRFYAMDRDFRWDRVQQAYFMLTQGAEKVMASADEAIQHYYSHPTDESRHGDEFITPVSIAPNGVVQDEQRVRDGDAVIFFNYRGDRPREITKAFVLDNDDWSAIKNGGFDRGPQIQNLYFATMSRYEADLPTHVIFEQPAQMENILGSYLSEQGLKQFRCAESEKHPHVTYFFNDYREEPFDGELQQELPSPKHVSTYDQIPEMAALEVTSTVLDAIASDQYDFILVNYANGDMVGHTGVLAAAIQAVETVDQCVGRLVEAVLAKGGALVVTADHGNCEQMIDRETGRPHTAHTTYDVDLIVVDPDSQGKKLRSGGRLADIAPTVLDLLGLEKPGQMTGESLLR